MGCLSVQTLQQLLDGALAYPGRVEALAHAAGCPDCGPKVCPLRPSDVVGTCQVLKPIGPGTFGLRWVAKDSRDDARVELESIRVGAGWARVAERHRPLLGLGHRALAKVLGVLEENGVGAVERELVEGSTFDDWSGQLPREPGAVLSLWVDVGRGLDFAHAAGAVHGALGLDSVRFDAAGHPKLSGFGAPGAPQAWPEGGAPTKVGDQYCYAAALVRALTASTPAEVQLAERFGVIRSRLPGRVVHALERALAPVAARRFDSLPSLLDALRPSSLPRLLAGAAAAVLLVAVVAAYLNSRPPPCADSNAALDAVWNDARRDTLRKAIFRSKDPWANTAYGKTMEWVGGWAHNWSDQSKELCLAADAARQPASRVFLAQRACLAARASELDALVDELNDADEAALEHAPLAWELLGSPESCRTPPPVPPEAEQKLGRRLFAIDAALELGRFTAARDSAEKAAVETRSGAPALASRAALLDGRAMAATGKATEMVRLLDDARGLAAGLPRAAGLAAAYEAWSLARANTELDLARSALLSAEAAQTAEPNDALLAARTQQAHSALHLRDGNLAEGRAAAEAMGAAYDRAQRPAAAGEAFAALAQLALETHHGAEALTWQRSSCREWAQAVADNHPVAARCRTKWSNLALERGDAKEALAAIEPTMKALPQLWRAASADGVAVQLSYVRALSRLDRHREAFQAVERARAQANELGTTLRVIADVLPEQANETAATGDLEHAVDSAQAAAGAFSALRRPMPPVVALIARLELLRGRPAEALSLLERPDSAAVPRGERLALLGDAKLQLRKNAEALRALEDAVAADESAAREEGLTAIPAEHLVWLARAQWVNGDASRADATAQRALEQLTDAPDARLAAWAHLIRAGALLAAKREEPARKEIDAARALIQQLPPYFAPELLAAVNALK